MGRFISSQHILNAENLTKAQFKKIFVSALKKKGYVPCDEDSAALSYTLVFPKDRKWVSVLNPEYEPGGGEALVEGIFLAETFKTNDISLALVDSDFAVLDLIDSTGKRVDTLILGESYMDDPSPTGEKNFWQPLLTENSTWEQVMKIQDGSYTFAEDALAEFAPLIGMDSEQILLDNEDFDDSATVMYFKKAGEKKLTLNTLFTQIYGEALEPLGFKKPKLRQPYYVRVINDEIIHIIGINDMKSHLVAFGGIATVYRKELCLDHSFRQNERWLKTLMSFYVDWHISDKPFNQEIQSGFHYHEYIESQPLSKAVQNALNESMTWILPVLDNVKTLKDVADYDERVFKNYISICSVPLQESLVAPYSDVAIKFLLDDPLVDLEQRYLHFIKNTEEVNKRFNRPQEIIEKDRIFIDEMMRNSREKLNMFLEDKEMHDQTLEELARRKKANIERLRAYGVIM